MSGFSSRQLKKLTRPLDSVQIYKRCRDGKELSYIPGWVAISEANAVFGYAGWDRQTVHLERLYERSSLEGINCGYMARVRVVVRAGQTAVTREGTGFGNAIARLASDAHEKALKSAETDATKRALSTFGNRFGLFLYQGAKQQATPPHGAICGFGLVAPDGAILAGDLSPEAFAGGLRQLVEKTDSVPALDDLIAHNTEALGLLKTGFPHLTSRTGRHFADILLELAKARRTSLEQSCRARTLPPAPQTPPEVSSPESLSAPPPQADETAPTPDPVTAVPTHPGPIPSPNLVQAVPAISRPSRLSLGPSVDKSILSYALERRIRNKQHLAHVAAHPCVICGDLLCHAHHITFAQPRGLALKVSDEFTVPLCAPHHNQLHQSRPEKSWWKDQGLDPLPIAAKLWEETLRRLTAGRA